MRGKIPKFILFLLFTCALFTSCGVVGGNSLIEIEAKEQVLLDKDYAKGNITPVSKNVVIYSINKMNDMNNPNFFALEKHDFYTGKTSDLGLGEMYVDGMTFIDDTETLLLWASEPGSNTDFLTAMTADMKVKWRTDDLGVKIDKVIFSGDRYYVFASKRKDTNDDDPFGNLYVMEVDVTGKIGTVHEKYTDKYISRTFFTRSEAGEIIVGCIFSESMPEALVKRGNAEGEGVIMLCDGENFFPTEYILMEENHLPIDGAVTANELLSMSYNTANDKTYLDFIDMKQSKTLRSVDLSGIFRKYDLTYLGDFAFEKDGAYIRAVGGIDKKSKDYNRGIRSLFLYFDADGNHARTVGVKLDSDFEIDLLYITDEDDRALYCVALDYDYDYDKLLAFEIDKADLRQ